MVYLKPVDMIQVFVPAVFREGEECSGIWIDRVVRANLGCTKRCETLARF